MSRASDGWSYGGCSILLAVSRSSQAFVQEARLTSLGPSTLFADHARRWCPWSKAYYRIQRNRGMKHHAALRKLASRWIRILFVVWKTRTPYDPAKYLRNLRAKSPKIIPFLAN